MTAHVLANSGRTAQRAVERHPLGIRNKVASAWQSFKRLSSKNLDNVFAAMAAEWPTEY
jgi:hypothetical protein